MDIRHETTIAELAAAHPATIRIFQRHGIDFCCGGKRALAEVCEESRLSFDEIKRLLEGAVASPQAEGPGWHTAPLPEVVDHILERYHRPLDEELPRLDQLMRKVAHVHGERHPELLEVARTFTALCDDLGPHMMKEERILFPYILKMSALANVGTPLPGSPFGSIESPISVMEREHESVGTLLADLRRLTSGYVAPDDACNSFRGLLHGLAELERDTHQHIHIENNVLFPRAKALEA